jgi:hypothetical protein
MLIFLTLLFHSLFDCVIRVSRQWLRCQIQYYRGGKNHRFISAEQFDLKT